MLAISSLGIASAYVQERSTVVFIHSLNIVYAVPASAVTAPMRRHRHCASDFSRPTINASSSAAAPIITSPAVQWTIENAMYEAFASLQSV